MAKHDPTKGKAEQQPVVSATVTDEVARNESPVAAESDVVNETPAVEAAEPAPAGSSSSDNSSTETSSAEPAPLESYPDTAEDAPAPQPTPAAQPRKLGFFGVAVAALVSGLLGGAVAFALVGTFYSADANIDAITELEARALDLRQRVEVLETHANAPAPVVSGAEAPQELATRLDALEAGLSTLGTKVDNLPTAGSADTSDLTARLSALEQRLVAVQAASPDALNALGSRLDGLEKQLTQSASDQKAGEHGTAQLVALGALQDAIVDAVPFSAELAASRALLGSSGDALAALQSSATAGFPNGMTLAVRLMAAADGAKGAAEAPAASDGVLDRLMDSASKLVTIRRGDDPVEDPNSDRARLTVARLALERGDFTAAAQAIDAMSATSRAPLVQVDAIIKARQSAIATIASLKQGILATLSGGKQ